MRSKTTNTMYRRRTVRPDGNVYRQTRKLASGGSYRRRAGAGRIVLVAAALVAGALVLWLWRK